MNELAKSEKTMSSRTIAELTGKLHNHVMRDIKNMEDAYVEVFGRESKFGLSSYQAGNRYYPEYMLTKSQTLFVISGYDAVVRAKVQQRWEHLEAVRRSAQVALPSRKELALMIIEAEEELAEANQTIALQAPAVEFVEDVFKAKSLFTMAEAAKSLGMGRNTMFSMLRGDAVLMRNNEPYQTFITRGYFVVKGSKVGSGLHTKVFSQTHVTMKGLDWIRRTYF